jgi:hypothetical protein
LKSSRSGSASFQDERSHLAIGPIGAERAQICGVIARGIERERNLVDFEVTAQFPHRQDYGPGITPEIVEAINFPDIASRREIPLPGEDQGLLDADLLPKRRCAGSEHKHDRRQSDHRRASLAGATMPRGSAAV